MEAIVPTPLLTETAFRYIYIPHLYWTLCTIVVVIPQLVLSYFCLCYNIEAAVLRILLPLMSLIIEKCCHARRLQQAQGAGIYAVAVRRSVCAVVFFIAGTVCVATSNTVRTDGSCQYRN